MQNDIVKRLPPSEYFECLRYLLNSQQVQLDKAIHTAVILHASDPELFFSTFLEICSGLNESNVKTLCRALAILDELGHFDAALPLLRTWSEYAHEHVRSKATKLLCKATFNIRTVQEQLRSEDGRVRANALEALWFHQTPESAKIFRSALSDSCHRVVVNALVGLYHQNDDSAMETLLALSQHPSELFRAAAIWAFLHLYDDRAITALKSMTHDHSEIVRSKAANVLARFLYVADWNTWPQTASSNFSECSANHGN